MRVGRKLSLGEVFIHLGIMAVIGSGALVVALTTSTVVGYAATARSPRFLMLARLWASDPGFCRTVLYASAMAVGCGIAGAAILRWARLRSVAVIVFSLVFASPIAYLGAALETQGLPERACFAPARGEVLLEYASTSAPIVLAVLLAVAAALVGVARYPVGRLAGRGRGQ
jgi:hypothetical protein